MQTWWETGCVSSCLQGRSGRKRDEVLKGSQKRGLCHPVCALGDSREGSWDLLAVACVVTSLSIFKCVPASMAMFAQELSSIRHFRVDRYQSSTCSLRKYFSAGMTIPGTLKCCFESSFTRDLFPPCSFVNPHPRSTGDRCPQCQQVLTRIF